MTTPLSDDFASARRPLLAVVPDPPEPEPSVWVEVDGETLFAFGFILLALVALTKFLVGFDGDWARLGWYLLAAVAAPPLIMIAIGARWAAAGITLHGHGITRPIAVAHEKRHVKALNGLDIKHHGYKVWPDGDQYQGLTKINKSAANMAAWNALPAEKRAAVYMAGAMGPEGKLGCESDLAAVDSLASRAAATREAGRLL